jgi:phosphohistidine phosphatase SixA
MKSLLFMLAFMGCLNCVMAQQSGPATRIYIVRHGEKEPGPDPSLTPAGANRAGDLMRTLKNESVQRIYVSRYRRTMMTADSIRLQLGVDTVQYMADTLCDELVNSIMQHRDFGKTILIIAHSNTIPKIIRKLGVSDHPQADIPDKEYDNLYLVTYKNGKAIVKQMKFGASSAASAPMQ